MNTIKEDYVSYEVAKLLKEKGFDIPVRYEYHSVHNINQKPQFHRHLHNFNGEEYGRLRSNWYSAPTLQMACKWLREVHNLFIFPFPQMNTNKFWTEIYQLSNNQEWENLYCESIDLQDYSTYEEACEAALKYTLENLI